MRLQTPTQYSSGFVQFMR